VTHTEWSMGAVTWCDFLGGWSHKVTGIAKCHMSHRVGILEFESSPYTVSSLSLAHYTRMATPTFRERPWLYQLVSMWTWEPARVLQAPLMTTSHPGHALSTASNTEARWPFWSLHLGHGSLCLLGNDVLQWSFSSIMQCLWWHKASHMPRCPFWLQPG